MIELTVTKTSENPSVFTLSPSSIEIGGKDSNLIDYIHVNIPEEWQGKVIRVTFNQSTLYGGNTIPKFLNADGVIELKSDVTLCSGDLVIDAVGVDGSVSPSTGCHYTVYNHPKFGGTEQVVTPSEYQQFVAETKGYSDSAQANATAADESKSAALLSEWNAKNSETASLAAQQAAENAKLAAQGSAEAAAQSETNAKASETAAKTSETNSKTSETNSASNAIAAAGSATAADASKTAAETAASAAQATNIVNPQSWTDTQKSIARTNIGAVSTTDLNALTNEIAEKTSYGVYSGLGVTAQSTPNMTVNVATGTIYMANGDRFMPTASIALAVSAADATNSRIDIVYVNSSGVVTYLAGIAMASPIAPSVPTGGQKLAEIAVSAGATGITNVMIVDRRKYLWTESWYSQTLLNGWTGEVKFTKSFNGIVYFKISIVCPSTMPPTTSMITNFVPSGYRPNRNVPCPAVNSNSGAVVPAFYIDSNGALKVAENSGLTVSRTFTSFTSYIALS